MKSRLYFTYKVQKNGKTIDKCQTHSPGHFRNKIRTINWKELMVDGGRVYLRVNYGKLLDNFGKMSEFHNDGIYEDKESFYSALKAFLEN